MTSEISENSSELNLKGRAIDILLVEDNLADIKLTMRAFKEGNLQNTLNVVHNGQEAVDYVLNEGVYKDAEKYPSPDLILMDIIMPKMDGFEALKRLKEDGTLNYIPVVMLTTSINEEDIIKSFKYGAVSYIPKPIAYDDFVKVVNGFNFYWQIISKLPRKQRKA